MSIVEERMREYNENQKAISKNCELEHLAEKERNRIASENCIDPRLIAFKKRREEQVLRHRKSSSW
jgi:hypothetical protein